MSLQENNALAKVDIAQAKILAVYPLGFKDHGLVDQGMDVSDLDLVVDGKATGPKINIQPWQGVRGLYMPDAITSYDVNGRTYIVTVNEVLSTIRFASPVICGSTAYVFSATSNNDALRKSIF